VGGGVGGVGVLGLNIDGRGEKSPSIPNLVERKTESNHLLVGLF